MATRTISDAGGNWDNVNSWVEGAVPTAGDDVVATGTSGNLTINVNTAVLGSFVMTNYTGTLTHNSSRTLYCSGNITFVAGMTYTPVSSTASVIRTSGGSGTVTTAGHTISSFYAVPGSGNTTTLADNLTMTGHLTKSSGSLDFTTNTTTVTLVGNAAAQQLVGGMTFYNLTITGYAATTAAIYLDSSHTITNNLVINGNSALNRVLVYSNTLGTQRTITAANVSVSNADFRDITGAGAGDWDISGATGGSGDCGGNTGITFTTADNWYWKGSGTRNFSDYTYWYTATNGGGSQMASTRAPLPQDTMYIDANSIDGATHLDQDMARIPAIDFSGCDAMTFDMSNLDQECYGSFTLSSNVTLTFTDEPLYFYGRGSHTITSAGKSFQGSISFYAYGGTYTLADNFTCRMLNLVNGTLDAATNNVDVTCLLFNSDGTSTRQLDMGNGTWTLSAGGTGAYATLWDTNPNTNLTLNCGQSTITFSGGGNLDQGRTYDFNAGDGLTFYNLTLPEATHDDGECRISGSSTYNTITLEEGGIYEFEDGTTQTVSSFVATGSSGKEITIKGSSTGGWTISDSAGTNSVSYCTISYSTAEGGATWNATDNCTDGGNNTGWNFGTVVEISSAESLTLTQNAPDMLVDVLAGNVALSLSIQTALSFIISPNIYPSPIYLNLNIPNTITIRIDNQLYDPGVVAGCPQCGTLMYKEDAFDIDVGSGRITQMGSGLNKAYGSDEYVRCKRCGFPCKLKRDHYSHHGSREGWGMVYTVQDATHYSGW